MTVALYLKGADLINFTHSCRKLYHLFNDEVFWKKKLQIENLIVSKHVKAFTNYILETKAFTKSIPVAKLHYIVLHKIYRNWKASTIESPPIQDLNHTNTSHNQFHTGLQNNHYFKLCTRKDGRSFNIEIKNLFGNTYQEGNSTNGQIMVGRPNVWILVSYIVVSYRDNFCPIIETFSLKTCEHLWMKSNSEIDMTETMRHTPEDVVTFNNCIAVFKFQNVKLHIFDDTSFKVNIIIILINNATFQSLFIRLWILTSSRVKYKEMDASNIHPSVPALTITWSSLFNRNGDRWQCVTCTWVNEAHVLK